MTKCRKDDRDRAELHPDPEPPADEVVLLEDLEPPADPVGGASERRVLGERTLRSKADLRRLRAND